MRRASIITVIVLAMIMATASVAIAKSSKHGVEKQKIIQIFDTRTGDPRAPSLRPILARRDCADCRG